MGGANNQKFGREGDLNSIPTQPIVFSLKPTIVPEIYIKLIKTNLRYNTGTTPATEPLNIK